MIQDLIDELITYISTSGREEEVARVREKFFWEVGGIFGEEDSFDMRIGTFFEWFIIDRRIGGTSILEEYCEKIDDEERKNTFLTMRDSIRSVFEVTGSSSDRLNLRDLNDKKKYVALTPWGSPYFKKKDILEVRLFADGNDLIMSQSYINHPQNVKKYIISRFKDAALSNDKDKVVNELAVMSFKWEKYRKFRIEDIYNNN